MKKIFNAYHITYMQIKRDQERKEKKRLIENSFKFVVLVA